jgi:hypothetical protein
MEHHAKLQKNQDRRLQRKNAAIIKEGGAPILLDRAPKADTSVCTYLLPNRRKLLDPLMSFSMYAASLQQLWADWAHE